jgi:lipopolysaccharide export system ATP-binding protein
MNKTLIVQNISKSYGKKAVIRDVSLSITQGEVVGLLGPNGAGKTTSFYMIVGLVKVDSGKILINNNDITKLSIHERAKLGIGYLPQESSIFRGLSVEDNIMSVLEIIEPNLNKRKDKLESLLDEFSIKHIRKSSALALSGGERRRTEIARSLAIEPTFILLDEPFAGVDPIAINDIREMVVKLTKKGVGILITDHNVRETLSIVDKAYIVHDGKILFSGSSKEIINNENVKAVYLGTDFSY